MEPLDVNLPEVNDVNVCLVNALNVPHAWVQPQWRCSVDTSDGNTVTRLDTIDKVIVGIHKHSVRGLTRGHIIC